MVVPFLEEKSGDIEYTLPDDVWYNYRSLQLIPSLKTTIPFENGRPGVFLRGGSIIPTKTRLRKSTELMFYDPYTLVIALDRKQEATGELFVDDEVSFDYMRGSKIYRRFIFADGVLRNEAIECNMQNSFVSSFDNKIEMIRIAGLKESPKGVIVIDTKEVLPFTFENGVLSIKRSQLLVAKDWSVKLIFD